MNEKICPNCGGVNPQNSAFCGFCGKNLKEAPVQNSIPQPVQAQNQQTQYHQSAPKPQYQQTPYQQPIPKPQVPDNFYYQPQAPIYQQAVPVYQNAPVKKKNKWILPVIIIASLFLIGIISIVIIAVAFLIPKSDSGLNVPLFNNELVVDNIDIDRFEIIGETYENDIYKVELSSECTKEFIAFVEIDMEDYFECRPVIMQNGSASFTFECENTKDASLKVNTYMEAKAVDFTDVYTTQDDFTYYEIIEESFYTGFLQVVLDNNKDGMAVISLSCEEKSDEVYELLAPVENGVAQIFVYESELPLDTYSVNYNIENVFFQECEKLTEEDYTITEPFAWNDTLFFAEEAWQIKDVDYAYIIYHAKYVQGKPISDCPLSYADFAYSYDGKCRPFIYSADDISNKENILYDFSAIGFVEIKCIEE